MSDDKKERQLARKDAGGIVAYLETIKPKLEEAATKSLTPDRLIRVFLGIAARNDKIHQCTRESIVNALSLCNSTGLEPGGVLKHADLIPRWNKHAGPLDKKGKPKGALELNFQPRYGGLAELARRSGQVTRINAAPVYRWEVDGSVQTADGLPLFQYSVEPPSIRHDTHWDPPAKNDKDIVGGYAVAELQGGHRVQLWFSRADIEKRRAKSQQPNGNFWKEWFPEMVRKTLLRALFSGGMVPMSAELAVAMEHDPDRWDTGGGERSTATTRGMGLFAKREAVDTDATVVDLGAELQSEIARGMEAGLSELDIANALQAEGIPNTADKLESHHVDEAARIIGEMIDEVGG